MSTLRTRKDGLFFIDLHVNGRRRRVSLKTKDKRLAAVRARHAERQLAGQLNTTQVTLDAFIGEYLEYARPRKTPMSLKADVYALSRLRERVRVKFLHEITPRMAAQVVTELSEGRKIPTVNGYVRGIKHALNIAVDWEYLEKNPFGKIQQVKYELPVPRVLSPKEIDRILAKARELKAALVPLIEFYLLSGARRNEALNLEWKDMDWERGIIVIRNTKGKRPRIILMSPRVQKLLKARQELERPFLFTPWWVSHRFADIAKAAGVACSLHDLRRSFSSHIQAAGMPSLFLTKLIGHTDTIVTEKHYTGFGEDMVKQYYEELEKRLFK